MMTEVDQGARAAGLYRTARLIRRFEETVRDLVTRGEIAGVTHEYIGQEAVATGVCAALRDHDLITSTHRGHGHLIARGAEVGAMFAELMGRSSGLNKARGGSMHVADLSRGIYGANGIVVGGTPFALGAVWAKRLAGESTVGVAFFGDGGLNQGLLHECMNLAQVWSIPVLFVCENNGYAVTTSHLSSTAGAPVERAASYGMPSHRVDGMDAIKVSEIAEKLVGDCRGSGRPAFLECATYRFVGHHTAEATMGITYREDAEIEAKRAEDPLVKLRSLLDSSEVSDTDASVEKEIAEALESAEQGEAPNPDEAARYMYASGLVPRAGWQS